VEERRKRPLLLLLLLQIAQQSSSSVSDAASNSLPPPTQARTMHAAICVLHAAAVSVCVRSMRAANASKRVIGDSLLSYRRRSSAALVEATVLITHTLCKVEVTLVRSYKHALYDSAVKLRK
jgi:PhoPQ-activated pathogenicity-related protein